MSFFENTSFGLYLAAIVAGYALLYLTILLPGPLAAFSTVIMIVSVIIIVLFSVVLIVKALRSLLSR
ncbi:hypothetical protein [Siminovitchia fortis]|uniref:Uncharacterized protein n=1 Tax=Siminovitchia fortis TaxID=254758 RepID=A0A443IQZ4_9BACI|nr:hypothetical protein [Siminovitchia fortis]RWR08590.1 hypothetical protein D4N35_011290 [Siminovitchia fortis]WHY83171.1 hypothetical protein QNH23_07295 [Siminovitchia fortis]